MKETRPNDSIYIRYGARSWNCGDIVAVSASHGAVSFDPGSILRHRQRYLRRQDDTLWFLDLVRGWFVQSLRWRLQRGHVFLRSGYHSAGFWNGNRVWFAVLNDRPFARQNASGQLHAQQPQYASFWAAQHRGRLVFGTFGQRLDNQCSRGRDRPISVALALSTCVDSACLIGGVPSRGRRRQKLRVVPPSAPSSRLPLFFSIVDLAMTLHINN